ncbi:MAG TPA: DUF459 domain-containing protein, partial [Actinomycetota bacterium]|nr:DUF459 domain-containing protein [Actinomycetota bacterium]
GRPLPSRPQRQLGPAGRVLVIGLVCFALWTLLAAPALRRSAETSPLGIRRTASLVVLRPLSRISALLGIDRLGDVADRALGRTNAAPGIPPPAPPAAHPIPTGPSPSLAPLLPVPTRANPLTVLVVGDSLGADLAQGMSRLLSEKGTFRPREDTRESTGLARPDYFNWPYQVAIDISERRPDVVVAMFGGNDNQNFLVGDHGVVFGSREWRQIYGTRVGRLMDLVTKSGRPMIWVGLPVMKDPGRSKQMRILNSVYAEQAARHPGVSYVDSYRLFSSPRGGYAAYLRDADGHLEQVREGDGIHLTVGAGGARLADAVFQAMRALWRVPATPLPTSQPGPEMVPHGKMPAVEPTT